MNFWLTGAIFTPSDAKLGMLVVIGRVGFIAHNTKNAETG